MTANADEIEYWNVVAGAKWVANQAQLDRLMAPLSEALLQIAVPAKGEAVLDIGCGCGALSLALAEAVGPRGHVTSVDVSQPMLAHARARAAARQGAVGSIDWIEADAMTHAFEPVYDLVASRFGVMFFDDRARAFANLRKAVKPMGRFAFVTWRARAEIEWMQTPLEWMSPVLPVPEPSDGAIGPCAFADGEATREQLADAGFRDVIAEPLDRELVIGESVDEAYALLLDAGAAARQLRDADKSLRPEAERLLRQGLESRASPDGRVIMRSACWIYRGHV